MKSFFWRSLLVRFRLTKYFSQLHAELQGRDRWAYRYSARTLAVPVSQLLDPALLAQVKTLGTIDLAGSLPVPTCEALRWHFAETGREHPLGNLALRSQIAERVNRECALGLSGETNLLITHGASGAWGAFLDAWIDPNDGVALFEPCSAMFRIGLLHRRANVRIIPVWSEAGTARFDASKLRQALKGAKCLVLSEPINPTGATWSAEEWEQLAFWIRKYDLMVYLDASFAGWRYDAPLRNPLGSFPGLPERLCLAGGLSGAAGHSSLRVGWIAAPEPLREPIAAAQHLSAPFVSSVSQALARNILNTAADWHEERVQEYSNRRLWVFRRLESMGLQPVWPGGGLWMWVRLPDHLTASPFAQDLLTQTGVLVQPGEIFGSKCQSYIRLNYTGDEGRLQEGLNRLAQFLIRPEPAKTSYSVPEIQVLENHGETFDHYRDSTNALSAKKS